VLGADLYALQLPKELKKKKNLAREEAEERERGGEVVLSVLPYGAPTRTCHGPVWLK